MSRLVNSQRSEKFTEFSIKTEFFAINTAHFMHGEASKPFHIKGEKSWVSTKMTFM